MAREDAQSSNDVTQLALDALSTDLAMEGVMIREEMNFKWICEEGLVEKIEDVVQGIELEIHFYKEKYVI